MDKNTSDQDLIKQCLAHKKQAQELLYLRFSGKMMSVCLRYAGSRPEAEDMLQEGFIRVFKSLPQFKATGSLEGWIRSIIVHVAIRNWQQQKKNEREELNVHFELQDSTVSAIDQLSAKELMAMITKLPNGYRMVFNMYILDGYSHQEIASMTGIQEGTSRSQLAKSRMVLQKMILSQQVMLNKSCEDEKER